MQLRAFPGNQDGPKPLCRGQLGSNPTHSAAHHDLPSDSCYSPLAGFLYLLTEKSLLLEGDSLFTESSDQSGLCFHCPGQISNL